MEFTSKIAPTKVEHYLPAFESLDELVATVSSIEFENASFGDVEEKIQERGQEILRKMAQGYLNQRSAEEEKQKCVTGADGKSRSHRQIGTRKIESRFGEVEASRIGCFDRLSTSIVDLNSIPYSLWTPS